MRVAFFIPYFREGGVESTTHRLAACFRDRGHRVDLLTFGHDSSHLRPDSPFDVVDLDASRTLTSVPAVVSYLRDVRPDGLLATHYFANICAVVARSLARSDARLVLTERLSLSHVFDGNDSLKYRLFPTLIRLTYPLADARVAVSADAAQDLADLAGLPASAVRHIYNPTLVEEVYQAADEPLEHPWFADDDRVLLGVGRLTGQKDFQTLIEALAAMDRPDVRLVILGEGPRRADLEGLIAELGLGDRVELPGYVENPYKYMARADLFVLSSRFEGMPNVLVEAAALGTPVVATECPTGPAELLEGGKYGRLVPVGDPQALARAIDKTLANLPAARADVERLQSKLEGFRPEVACERYLEVLRGGAGGD